MACFRKMPEARKLVIGAVAAATVAAFVCSTAQAASRTWTGATDDQWSDDTNWLDSLAPADSTSTDRALFNNNATVVGNSRTTVTVETQSVNGVDIDAGSLSFTIGSSVNQGELRVGVANAGATAISVSAGTSANQTFNSTLNLNNSGSGGGVSITNSGTGKLTIAGTIQKVTSSGGNTLSFNASGEIDVTGKIGAASGFTNGYNVQKNSAGTLRLLATDSTWTGYTRVNTGTVQFAKIANAGSASSLGASQSSSNNTADKLVLGNAVLEFIGDTAGDGVTNRLFTIASGNSVLEASGSVPLQFTGTAAVGTVIPQTQTVSSSASSGSNTLTFSDVSRLTPGMAITGSANIPANTTILSISGNTVTLSASLTGTLGTSTALTFHGGGRTLVLGGDSTADNTMALALVDPTISNGADPALTKTTITKRGASKWILAGANTYTGATTVEAGTLVLASTGSIASSSGVEIHAGSELDVSAHASYALLDGQPLTFGLDSTGAGSAGLLRATALDISDAVVNFDILGSLDDAAYVIASYTSLIGSEFASTGVLPEGYEIIYDYNGGTQIAIVVPEPATLGLVTLGAAVLARRRRKN